MKKIAKFSDVFLSIIACLVVAFFGAMFAGCENKYDAMQINLSTSEILLEIEDGVCQAQDVVVMIQGDESISRQVAVSTDASQLNIQTSMNDQNETVISISASAVCTNAVVTVTSLEGSKTASFTVSVQVPLKMMVQSQNAEQFFVVKGQAKDLKNAALVDLQPSNTTQKALDFELITQNQYVSILNGMLLVQEPYQQNTVSLRATSPHLPDEEVIFEVDVLPSLNSSTVQIQSITYPSGDADPIFAQGGVMPASIDLSSNLASKQSAEFLLEIQSPKPVVVMPIVLSTSSQSSGIIEFSTGEKTEIKNQSGVLTSTQYRFVLASKNMLGTDRISFAVKYQNYDFSYNTNPLLVVVKDTVNKIELFADGKLSNQTHFTVYNTYQNKTGLELSFNVLPTTISQNEKTLVLQTGFNASAYSFWLNDSETPIVFDANGKFEFEATDTIFVKANSYDALNGQISIFAKENPVVKKVISFSAAAGTTDMQFVNASETITAPNGSLMYYYNLSSNAAMYQAINVRADIANLEGLSVECDSDLIAIDTQPMSQGDYFQFYIHSIANKVGTATITLRQDNGYFVEAYVRVIYELKQDEVAFSVPSPQTNSAVGFMEQQIGAPWQFRVAINLGSSITLSRTGLGITNVSYAFFDILKSDDNQTEYENFFADHQNTLEDLTFEQGSLVLDTKFLALNQLKPKAVGKTWVQVTVEGLQLDNNGALQTVQQKYYFLVEGFVPAENFGLSTYKVNLLSQSSVGYEDYARTKTDIVVSLNNATYQNIMWLNVSANHQVAGYGVYSAKISEDNKTLSITALSTWSIEQNVPVLLDQVTFVFTAVIKEFSKEYRLDVEVTISKAVQVEKIIVSNVNLDNGIYIPLTYNGQNITRQIEASVQVGESGKIPYNTSLVYEFLPNLTMPSNMVSINRSTGLLTVNANAQEGTYGQIRVAPADRYDQNNKYNPGANDIAVYFPLVVADGNTRQTSFRVSSIDDFALFAQNEAQMQNMHFTLLNDISITSQNALSENFALFENFNGGLYGAIENGAKVSVITTTLPLFGNLGQKAFVEDLFVQGAVVGSAFVAEQNLGTIKNVHVVAKENIGTFSTPSTLTANAASFVGGLVGKNSGEIAQSSFTGKIDAQNATAAQSIGGIAGFSDGTIDFCVVEFCAYLDNTTTVFDGILAGEGIVGGLVGTLANGSLSNSYIQSYIPIAKQNVLIASTGPVGVLVGSIAGGNINSTFGYVQNQQNLFGQIYSAENNVIENAYITFKAADDAVVLGQYYYNFKKIDYFGNANDLVEIQTNDVWNASASLPVFKSIQVQDVAKQIPLEFKTEFISAQQLGQSSAIMFYYETLETLTLQESILLKNKNFVAFSNLFDNAVGIRAFSSNANVVQVLPSGLQLVGKGQAQITFYSQYNAEVQKTYSIYVVNPISSPSFETGTTTFGNNYTLNIKTSQTMGFVVSIETSAVLDAKPITFKTESFDVLFNTSAITGGGEGPFTITTTNLEGETLVTYALQFAGTSFDDALNAILQNKFSGSFTINVYQGADKIQISNSQAVIEPIDPANITVTLFSDVKLEDGEALEILLTTYNGFDENIFEYQISLLSTKYYSSQDLSQNLPTESGAKYFVYEFSVNFVIKQAYRSENFENQKFDFIITSKTALSNHQTFGLDLVCQNFEVVVNTQQIISVSASHYHLANKSVLTEDNKNFVFYEYSTQTATNIIAPGEEGLLRFDLYPNFARFDYVDITYSVQNQPQDVSLMLSVLTPYTNPANGNQGFRQGQANFVQLENGIRLFGINQNANSVVSTIYIATYLPLSVNTDAVIDITISGQGFVGEGSGFTLVVEYLEEALIQIVDNNGNPAKAVAKGTTSNLFITLPKEQNLSLDYVNILGVQNSTGSAETSVSLVRTQIIEDEFSLTRTYKFLLEVGSQVQLENNQNQIIIEATTSWVINGKMQIKVSTFVVPIVDFLIEDITLLTDKTDKSTYYAYIGIEGALQFDFDGKSNTSSNAAFQAFLQNHYYENLSGINSFGDFVVNAGKKGNNSFLANLYYVNGSSSYAIMNQDGSLQPNNYFTFFDQDGQIKLLGKRQGEVDMRFVLLVQYPNATSTTLYEISFDFKIVVVPFTDENLPLIIDNETAFYDALEADVAQDYILMSDLYLQNVNPISTRGLKSLDGNNFTIHIQSFDTITDTTNLSLALFDEVSADTTLKNLTINLCVDEIDIAVQSLDEFNIAGLALTNNGIIYNCQVVSTNGSGIKINYTGTAKQNFVSYAAGFVIDNSGYITNSRVGGESLKKVATSKNLLPFPIVAQGNISGFVDSNSGTIAASFFANGTLTNTSLGTSSSRTSGFARLSTGVITTSYVKGTGPDAFSLTGEGITTSGVGAGFIASNSGKITNSYSNILLASQTPVGLQTGRLSAGFVYQNYGTIESSFTASKIENAKSTQMAFVGVDDSGNLQNYGTIKLSYYYSDESIEGDAYSNQTSKLNVVRISEPNNPDNFYGFSFASSATSVNGVWFATGFGIDLVSANQITVSNRYVANQQHDETTGELISYNLPYTQGYEYGSQINPIIIRSAEEFNKAFGGDDQNAGTAIASYYNLGNQTVFGNYRLICNIDLQELNPDNTQSASIASTQMTLQSGVLDGNMLTIYGVDLTATADAVIDNFGLFKNLTDGAIIKNLSISVVSVSAKQARFVGALTGSINNSKLININVFNQSAVQDATILGNNVVGGLVGLVSGQSEVHGITVSGISAKANALATQSQTFARNGANTNVSYAGGVIGVADIFTISEASSQSHKTDTNVAALSNLVAQGAMQVRASSVGGVIGWLGPQTNLRDATFESPAGQAKIVAYNFYAGGIVGECYGNIDMAKAQHDATTQKQIEDNISAYYHSPAAQIERGNLALFDDVSEGSIITSYTPVAIGGLVGKLVNGEIQHSYSKLNVICSAATYAGGLVGEISAIANPRLDRNKVILFETYAFGDVKAEFVGGIVGYIDSGRTTVMTKVNAVNFWGLEKDLQNELHLPQNTYQIYAATNSGQLSELATLDVQENIVTLNGSYTLPTIICTSSYEDMYAITEVKFNGTTGTISEYAKPSFAFMQGGAPYNMVYDPYFGLQESEKTGSTSLTTQAVVAYYNLSDPTTNGLAMDTYFIQANWDANYWVRYTQTNDLLPSLVTFTESMSYYIDVAADLQKMLYHPYATFIVRALNQPSKIIPVGQYIESTNLILSNFSGTLKGFDNTQNYGFDFEGKSSFILATTGASFYNLTIQKIGSAGIVNEQNQAFVDVATLTSFENILIKDCIATTQISETNFNVGLLANKLVGGYLNGISVQNSVVDVTVKNGIKANEIPVINVGMVAGQLQTNQNALFQMSDVCVYQTSSEANFQNVNTNNLNFNLNGAILPDTEISIGSIMGETLGNVSATYTSKSATGTYVKGIGVATSATAKYTVGQSFAQSMKGTVLTLLGSGQAKTFNAGLLFGKTNTMQLAFSRATDNQKLQIVGGIRQTGNALGTLPSLTQANLGGIVGKVETTASIQNTTSGHNKFLQVDAAIKFEAETLNAGMLVGLAANISKIQNIDTFGEISAKASGVAHLGGVIGTINSTIMIANTASQTNLSFKGQNGFVGGLVGAYTATSGTLEIGDIDFGTKFLGEITVSGSEIYAGGILGAIKTETNIISTAKIQNAVFGGQIVLSQMTGNAYVGGIVGNTKAISIVTASPQVQISNCLAYGNINVLYDYLAQSGLGIKVYVGGLVGIGSSGTTLSANTSLVTVASKTSATLDGAFINALMGDANGAGAEQNNYYSHQISLCLDLNENIKATNLYVQKTDPTLTGDEKSTLAILDILHTYIETLTSDEKTQLLKEGTKLNPIKITSAADWQAQEDLFEKTKTQKVFALVTKPFTLDANPLTLCNVHILGDGQQIVAHNQLFKVIDENSAVSGLDLVPSIQDATSSFDQNLGASAVGAVANINYGFVFACAVKTLNISASEHTSLACTSSAFVGGLVGYNKGVIMDSFTAINISATSNAGGLVGNNAGNIISSYSVGKVDGGQAFSAGNGVVYSSFTASPASQGVFGTTQTVVDSFYDLYATGKKSDEKFTTDTSMFSIMDNPQTATLLFEAKSASKKFAFVVGQNFGYPTFAGPAYQTLAYMQGLATGTGTQEDPFLISNVGKLQQISSKHTATTNHNYRLICDIATTQDMATMSTYMQTQNHEWFNKGFAVVDWAPIADFAGTLSGKYGENNAYEIKDLSTTKSVAEWAIFGALTKAKISDLEITYSQNLELNAQKLSGLAGAVSDSTIDNITINASKVATTAVDSVTLSALVGEVKVGEEKTEISNIKIKTSTFDAESARSATIGGLIATMEVGAETSLSSVVFENALTITTKGSGTNVAGGLVGSAQSLEGADVTLDNVTIKSIGEGQSILGGVFGKAEELSEFSAKAGTVVLESSSISPNANTIGGFAGSMVSSVVEGDSSITGVTITFNGSGLLYAGGVAGEDASSTINNFAPAADITNNQGSQSHVGGLVGDATGTEIHASGQDQSGLDLESFSFTIVKPEGALATTAMSVGGVVGFGHSGTTLGTSLKVKNTFEHDIDFADELYLGGLAGNLDGAKVQGANIEKVKLEGIHVGAVAGKVANSTIFASNITSPQITAMFSSDNVSYAGAVAGQMVASTISGTNVTTEGNAGFVKTAEAPTEEVKNPEGETVLQKLSATTYIGGFAGHMTDKCVIDQNSTSSISISCQTAGFVGGMVGKADDLSVSGAQISGNINAGLDQEFAAETLYVGGLAGEAKGTFINVTYRGEVSEISAFMAKVQDPKVAVGGIVGHSTKATFEGIAVEGATVQGTYVAGGILGSGSEITFQGTASINPTGQKSYYSNTVNQTTTVAAGSTVQPANGEYPSVATTYAGGIVGRLEGTENTISACQSLAKVQSGWSKINTLLQQRDFFYYDQSGDDEGRQDYTKRKLSEKIDAVNSGSVGTDKSYAGGIVGFAESLTIEKVDNKGAVEAKARTSLVINTADVFQGDLLAGGANYDSYSHYGFENSDAFATGIGYLQNGTLGENCTNAGVITGGQKLEFNIFTTDGGENDNIYKSYLLDYGFTYENGNKIDIQNSFEGLYEDDPFGANAWLDAQSQGLRLVASENATGDMAKYTNGTAYPPMADTVDADKYVLVSDWNNTSSTPVYTNMHYGQYVDGYYLSRSTDAGQSPLSGILFPDGLTLEKHSPTASFKAPAYYFIYTLWNSDVRYMTGPYQHIFEETGKDPENPDNDVTLYYYYNITQNSNGTYSVGSKVTPEYGTAAYDNLKARALSNKYTINPTTVNTYNLGFIGDKCNFPTANNIDTQSNCFILSNQDGEVYISNPDFTLSTSQPKLVNLMVISSASSIKDIELPNPQPYDDFNPVDEELTTGAVKVWTNDTTIELDGTTHTALNGPVEFIYPAYNETYDDKGKEIWFATWVDATDTRRYTILHWVGDELKLVNQIPEGYVTSQTIPVGPEGKYVEGQTFNVTYRIFKYKPASTE